MTERTLPVAYQYLREREVGLLVRARETLAKLEGANPEDPDRLQDMIEHLDQLFTLVVVGEFNSGKSSLINALLGDDYLETGILPTTARICVLRHGRMKARSYEGDILVLTHPAKLLTNMTIVDTPGTNAVFREHEAIARQYIHRSDFVFFVMSATHAFAETDRIYLELIREYGPKMVILLNQIDILAGQEQIDEVAQFIREQSKRLFGLELRVLPVSAKWALEGYASRNPIQRHQLLQGSRIGPVQELIEETLSQRDMLREKLNTPLRVLRAIASRHLEQVEQQLQAAQSDREAIQQVEAGEAAYRESVRARLASRLDPIDRIFESMYDRGSRFIDENLQIRRLDRLFNLNDFQQRFEQAVVADGPQRIADRVNEIVAEVIAEDRRQWEETLAALRRMLARHEHDVVGSVEGEFAGSLEVFEENVLRAERALSRYSKQDAAETLRETHVGALTDTAVIGISGLVGGGGLVVFGISELAQALAAIQAGAAASALLGPVGLAVGGAVTLGGAYVLAQRRLPRARREAKAKLRQGIDDLKEAFREALMASATEELSLFRSHVQDALAPLQSYLARLVDELEELRQELDRLMQEADSLQAEVAQATR